MEQIAIIVPYRDREYHLNVFVPSLKKYLEKQNIPNHIYVIHQQDFRPFNRAWLINIGFLEAMKDNYLYFVSHDVDMIPLEGSYMSQMGFTHLASRCEQFDYKMPYPEYFGGVNMFDVKSYLNVNGMPNDFFGWGAEDDCLRNRVVNENITIEHRDNKYLSLHHDRFPVYGQYHNNMLKLKEDLKIYKANGLSNIEYEIISIENKINYTQINVK